MTQYELNFGDYWRIIRRRRIAIGISFLTVFLCNVIYTNMQVPVYQTSVKVKVAQRRPAAGVFGDIFLGSAPEFMGSQEEVIKGRAVVEKAIKALGLIDETTEPDRLEVLIKKAQESISTKRIEKTDVIEIFITSTNPRKAPDFAKAVTFNEPGRLTDFANAVASSYVVENLEQKKKQFTAARRFIGAELFKVERELKESQENLKKFKEKKGVIDKAALLKDRLANLELELAILLQKATPMYPQAKKLEEQIQEITAQISSLPAEELQFDQLTQIVKDNKELVTILKNRYKESQIAEAENVSDVTVLDRAIEYKSPTDPNKKINILLGAILGLIIGLLLAFIKENLDTSISAIEEIETFLKVTVLGVVPHIGTEKKPFFISTRLPMFRKIAQVRSQLVALYDPESMPAAAYCSLWTSVQSAVGPGKGGKVLLVTSSGPLEGKTITIANYAVTAAQMGQRTLLVDCDLRRPLLHEIFGLEKESGLSDILVGGKGYKDVVKTLADILAGDLKWDDAMKVPGMAYCNIITAGHLPCNPAELLNSQKMLAFIEEARAKFDVVLLDTPPLIPVSDAILLAPKVDGVILIYLSGKTARGALKRTKTQLDNIKARVVGIVLNDVRAAEMELGASYYGKYTREKGKE